MSSEPELFFGRAARDDANVFRSNLVLALEACSRDDRLSKSVRFGSAQNLWLCLCVRVCLTDESLGGQYYSTHKRLLRGSRPVFNTPQVLERNRHGGRRRLGR